MTTVSNVPKGNSKLRRLQSRAEARGEIFDTSRHVAGVSHRAVRSNRSLRKFLGDGACRRCNVEEAVVSFMPDGRKPMFCEPCGELTVLGWQEFLEPEHRDDTFRRYRSLYGIGMAEYGLLYEAQGGLCLICRAIDRPLVVDHDHGTGLVRGLLCGQCNSAIGLLQDDPDIATRASKYLRLTKNRKPREGETPVDTLRRRHHLPST